MAFTHQPTRARLTQETETVVIPLESIKLYGTLLELPVVAAGSNLALIAGTPGTNSPVLQGVASAGGDEEQGARFTYALPLRYVGGEDLTIRFRGAVSALPNGVAVVKKEVYKCDKEGGIGSELTSDGHGDIKSTSFADVENTIDGSGLSPGGVLDISFEVQVDDSGGGSGGYCIIGSIELDVPVKG